MIRNDGYVAFAVWSVEEANPFFSTVNDVVDRFVEPAEADPDAPDAFRFASRGKLAGILEKAGAENVTERQLNFQIEAPISFEQFWQLRTEMSETLRKHGRPHACSVASRKQAAADAAQDILGGKMNFPAEALIVTGIKPAG